MEQRTPRQPGHRQGGAARGHGIRLVDLSDGADSTAVHEYGVQAAFVAASTAKVLAAEASQRNRPLALGARPRGPLGEH